MNGIKCGKMQLWPDLMYYPSIRLDGLSKVTTVTCFGRDSNSAPQEYKREALPPQPSCFLCGL
jgi:hypothetical protein